MAELTTTNIEPLQEERITRGAQDVKMFAVRHAIECLQPNTQTVRLDYRGMLQALQTALAAELVQQDAATLAQDAGVADAAE